jgi:hypothetical protein
MSKVYVTNFSGYTYDKADSYGELIYITKGFVNIGNINELKKRLNTFITQTDKDDYLLLSGNNLLCALALHLWINHHSNCKVLHWNGLTKSYDLHEISQ